MTVSNKDFHHAVSIQNSFFLSCEWVTEKVTTLPPSTNAFFFAMHERSPRCTNPKRPSYTYFFPNERSTLDTINSLQWRARLARCFPCMHWLATHAASKWRAMRWLLVPQACAAERDSNDCIVDAARFSMMPTNKILSCCIVTSTAKQDVPAHAAVYSTTKLPRACLLQPQPTAQRPRTTPLQHTTP